MKRTTTVNFLQIENSLQDAIVLCERAPEAPYTESFGERLSLTARALQELTQRADQLYLDWREGIKQRMLAAKSLHLCFDRIRDEIGEYNFEPRPSGQYNYWEHERLDVAAGVLVDFLIENNQLSDDDYQRILEADEWRDELTSLRSTLSLKLKDEARTLRGYKRAAPLRRQAIYRAMNVVDDFQRNYDAYQ